MATEQSGPVFVSYRQEDGTANGAELAWLLRVRRGCPSGATAKIYLLATPKAG